MKFVFKADFSKMFFPTVSQIERYAEQNVICKQVSRKKSTQRNFYSVRHKSQNLNQNMNTTVDNVITV